MKKRFKLGVIGCGYMAQSILRGAVLSDFIKEKKIIVSDISEARLNEVDNLGVYTVSDNKFVAENSDYLLLAVKGADFNEVVKSLGVFKPEKIISVMEGVKKGVIKNSFGLNAVRVARCIPNMPCSIGSGVIGIDMSDYNKSMDDIEFISTLFNCLGTVLSIDETKMDVVAGLNIGGPMYTFMFIDSLVDAGVKQGLTKGEAKILAVQSVIGAAEMIEREELTIPELLKQACGKGGASIEAFKMLEEKNFSGIVSDGVTSYIRRSKELSE